MILLFVFVYDSVVAAFCDGGVVGVVRASVVVNGAAVVGLVVLVVTGDGFCC